MTSWRDIPFRTVVRQQYDYSCDSAAVATLLRFHYGLSVGESEIFQSMYARGDQERIRAVGFSMLDMRNYLMTRGFRADGLRLSLDRLAALQIPTIALIRIAGMDINFGAVVTTYVNGVPALTTTLTWTEAGALIEETLGDVGQNIHDLSPEALASLGLGGLRNSGGIVLQDSNGVTALVHNVTDGALQNIIINNADGAICARRSL